MSLPFSLPAGRNCIIEWSADLTHWTPLQSGTSTGAVIEAIQETTGIGQRFYRLQVAD